MRRQLYHQANCTFQAASVGGVKISGDVSAKVINNNKLVYNSDDKEEVEDEEVDIVDRKLLVDILLDCWKRNGVKEGDLYEMMRKASL